MITRLANNAGVDDETHARLSEKISSCMTRMFRKPENGGNPFLCAYSAPKPHSLVRKWNGAEIETAATNGKEFFWNPEFLDKLDKEDVTFVMDHETYHIVFHHSSRMKECEAYIRNVSMDFVVNTTITYEHGLAKRPGTPWGKTLGEPMTLKEFIAHAVAGDSFDHRFFCDETVLDRSPESIYDEIMEALKKAGKGGNGESKDGTFDVHIPAEVSQQEVQADVMRAAQTTVQMRGTVPGAVEGMLGELSKPTLSFKDLIRSAYMKKCSTAGMTNDWKRCRKRWLAARPSQYLPKRHSHQPRWIAMLDTSGSMSEADMAYGISQLQTLGNSEGYVIPCDADPKWDKITKINSAKELAKVSIVGRTGTVFDRFFSEMRDKVGLEWDAIIVLTDGDCGTIPQNLRPHGVDVVWVVTRNHTSFVPPFGRMAPLRRSER